MVGEHVAALQEKASKMLTRLDGEQHDLHARALDSFDAHALAGDRLLHYDLHGGNLRVNQSRNFLAVDWSFGCAGAPGTEG